MSTITVLWPVKAKKRARYCGGRYADFTCKELGLRICATNSSKYYNYPTLDGPIRANRVADSHELPDSRESAWRVPELNHFHC